MIQFREKLSYILPPLASLELLAAEYLRETNTSNFIYYHLLMAICSLDALKKSSKKKDARIKKEKIKLLQQTIQWKGNRKVKDRDDKILGFDFVFGG